MDNNNNPAEMTNQDLEKEMQNNNYQDKATGNQEDVSKSTAAEGTLKTPAEDQSSAVNPHTAYNADTEQDLDDLVHRRAEEEVHNGNLPSPEDIPAWEDEDDDNKISS
jgi:hypothetical protein